jgi:flagellar hook-length control protein FliK
MGAGGRQAAAKSAPPAVGRSVEGKDEGASIAARHTAADTATKEILAGKQAVQIAGKASDALKASAEKTESEVVDGGKSALLARRRPGVRDGSEGADGAEKLIAASAAGPQRNLAAGRQAVNGHSGETGENKVEGSEAKKKDKRKERLEIELYDHRSAGSSSVADAAAGGSKAEAPSSNDKKAVAEADLVVNLRSGNAERGSEESASRPGAAPGTSFSDALARELRENANADIVKHASLVLKDGGEGLLRLSLKPDSLGAVKIRLEMADNRIAGRILVESDEALKAFEKELASLEQAFRDGGFDGASLELAVSSDGARGDSGNRNGDALPRPFFSERLASSTYDASFIPADGRSPASASESLVNVLV